MIPGTTNYNLLLELQYHSLFTTILHPTPGSNYTSRYIHACACVCMRMCVYVCDCVRVCMRACMCMRTYDLVCVYMCACELVTWAVILCVIYKSFAMAGLSNC